MPRRQTALTAQQILDSYDIAENESSDNEIDYIEKRIETSEDEAISSSDEEEEDLARSSSLPSSTTCEMINYDSRNVLYGRDTKSICQYSSSDIFSTNSS